MRENTTAPVIERYYKLDESKRTEEKEPFYYHKGGRMGLDCVCDLLRVDKGYFAELAETHGNQTANMIANGDIVVPKEFYKKKVRYAVSFREMSERCGVSAGTLLRRYKDGERGTYLQRPSEHGGGPRK